MSPALTANAIPDRDHGYSCAPEPGISGRQCCSSSAALSRPSSSRGLPCPVRRWRSTFAMSSSSSALTPSLGAGSGLSSVIETACHGKGPPTVAGRHAAGAGSAPRRCYPAPGGPGAEDAAGVLDMLLATGRVATLGIPASRHPGIPATGAAILRGAFSVNTTENAPRNGEHPYRVAPPAETSRLRRGLRRQSLLVKIVHAQPFLDYAAISHRRRS
jgi:hypothetical protein